MAEVKKYRILIVGGGIAGFSAAAFLKQSGFDITLVDKCPKWADVGYSLTVWPHGLKLLDLIGAGNEIRRFGVEMKSFSLSSSKGHKLADVSMKEIAMVHGAPISAKRSSIHKIIREKAKGVHVMLGRSVLSIEEEKDGVRVVYDDRSKDVFDIVILADGIHSKNRKKLFRGVKEVFLGVSGWLFWSSKQEVKEGHIPQVIGRGYFFGMYPANEHDDKVTSYVAMSKEKPQFTGSHVEQVKTILRRLGCLTPKVLLSLPKNDAGFFAHHHMEIRAPRLATKRVVLLGDAAHAMSPFSGMGVSMAVEDAFVLSQELYMKDKIADALKAYEVRRKKRLQFVFSFVDRMEFLIREKNPLFVFLRNMIARTFYKKYFVRNVKKIIETKI